MGKCLGLEFNGRWCHIAPAFVGRMVPVAGDAAGAGARRTSPDGHGGCWFGQMNSHEDNPRARLARSHPLGPLGPLGLELLQA